MTKVGEQLGAIIHGQLCAKRVDCDGDRPPVCLKIKNILHNLLSRAALIVAEVIEVTKICTIESVTDNLDVLLTKVLLRNEVADVRAKRCINKNALIQIRDSAASTESGDCLEHAQRVAALEKLCGVTLVESSCDEKNDVIDHVAVGDVIKELRQRICGHGAKVLKVIHHLRSAAFLEQCGGYSATLILEELSVVALREMNLHILQSLALAEIGIIVLVQNR